MTQAEKDYYEALKQWKRAFDRYINKLEKRINDNQNKTL